MATPTTRKLGFGLLRSLNGMSTVLMQPNVILKLFSFDERKMLYSTDPQLVYYSKNSAILNYPYVDQMNCISFTEKVTRFQFLIFADYFSEISETLEIMGQYHWIHDFSIDVSPFRTFGVLCESSKLPFKYKSFYGIMSFFKPSKVLKRPMIEISFECIEGLIDFVKTLTIIFEQTFQKIIRGEIFKLMIVTNDSKTVSAGLSVLVKD